MAASARITPRVKLLAGAALATGALACQPHRVSTAALPGGCSGDATILVRNNTDLEVEVIGDARVVANVEPHSAVTLSVHSVPGVYYSARAQGSGMRFSDRLGASESDDPATTNKLLSVQRICSSS